MSFNISQIIVKNELTPKKEELELTLQKSDLVELSIRDFLKYCGFAVEDYSQFIRHSKVPVRF